MAGVPEACVATYVSGWGGACAAGVYDSDSDATGTEVAGDGAGV